MHDVTHNVKDIDSTDRRALERLLGERLRENQQLIIRVVNANDNHEGGEPTTKGSQTLPDWCNVYEGLSDEEIADLERTILNRADLSRPSE